MRERCHGVRSRSDAWLHMRDTCPNLTAPSPLQLNVSRSHSQNLTSQEIRNWACLLLKGGEREREEVKERMSGSNLETRSLVDELRSFDSGGFFDLGHPLLNRMTESFIRAAGIGAIQAVTREAYFTAVESAGASGDVRGSHPSEMGASKKRHRFPDLRGENNHNSMEALVKSTGKETVQWGLAAGVYSGLTYGLKETRGVHDWKNSALAGAITGVALAMTCEDHSHEHVVQCAITGAAISTAANILTGIF